MHLGHLAQQLFSSIFVKGDHCAPNTSRNCRIVLVNSYWWIQLCKYEPGILLKNSAPKKFAISAKRKRQAYLQNKKRDKNLFEHKRVVMKILKMDKNNQYGNTMTKPLPTGSIKKIKRIPSMREFDLIVQGISGEDKNWASFCSRN